MIGGCSVDQYSINLHARLHATTSTHKYALLDIDDIILYCWWSMCLSESTAPMNTMQHYLVLLLPSCNCKVATYPNSQPCFQFGCDFLLQPIHATQLESLQSSIGMHLYWYSSWLMGHHAYGMVMVWADGTPRLRYGKYNCIPHHQCSVINN